MLVEFNKLEPDIFRLLDLLLIQGQKINLLLGLKIQKFDYMSKFLPANYLSVFFFEDRTSPRTDRKA